MGQLSADRGDQVMLDVAQRHAAEPVKSFV
jgi:hypothetical protein